MEVSLLRARRGACPRTVADRRSNRGKTQICAKFKSASIDHDRIASGAEAVRRARRSRAIPIISRVQHGSVRALRGRRAKRRRPSSRPSGGARCARCPRWRSPRGGNSPGPRTSAGAAHRSCAVPSTLTRYGSGPPAGVFGQAATPAKPGKRSGAPMHPLKSAPSRSIR